MKQLSKPDLVVKSAIICSEKPGKGLEAEAAPNPNQMNRLIGYLNGQKIVVAQRHGKGGMDFNKILGGKCFAVAADGISPVFVKKDGEKTNEQKKEDGMPLYSSSGFYLLSSKEYPSIEMMEAYTLLRNEGEQVWLLTEKQLAERKKFLILGNDDLKSMASAIGAALSDDNNLVSQHDEATNRRRKRLIEAAKGEAEDAGDTYSGAEFKDLSFSKKDGSPFVMFSYQIEGEPYKNGVILRESESKDEEDRPITAYHTAEEALVMFKKTAAADELRAAVAAGKSASFSFVQGHVMRTSVSFRRKAKNIFASATKVIYGDGVYILAAHKGWTKGIVGIMQSQHPKFPEEDYDAHHYVAGCRQAEIGMNKKIEGTGWTPPEGILYSVAPVLQS